MATFDLLLKKLGKGKPQSDNQKDKPETEEHLTTPVAKPTKPSCDLDADKAAEMAKNIMKQFNGPNCF